MQLKGLSTFLDKAFFLSDKRGVRRLFFLFGFGITLGTPSGVFAQPTCRELFQARETTSSIAATGREDFELGLVRDFILGAATTGRRNFSENSVANTAAREGLFGGKMILIERIDGLQWVSSYSPLRFDSIAVDPQGDPREAIKILGYDLAQILGLEVIDRDHLWVSSIDELNERIFDFNHFLVGQDLAPIQVTFYVKTYSSVRERLLGYLEEFAATGALPHAPLDQWGTFLHDVSFHRHITAAPKTVMTLLQKLAKERIAFWKFADAYFAKTLSAESARLASGALLKQLVFEVDGNSGALMRAGLPLLSRDFERGQAATLIPGRLSRAQSALGPSLETLAYANPLMNALNAYETVDSSSGSLKSKIETEFTTIDDILLRTIKGIEDKSNGNYGRYFFGSAVGTKVVEFLLGRQTSVWREAYQAYAESWSPDVAAANRMRLVQTTDDLIALGKSIQDRREELMRAAHTYWETKSP